MKEKNLVLQKKVDELTNSLEESEQNYVDKIRQLRQENNIRNMNFDNDSSKEEPEDGLSGKELIIN